MSMDRRKFLQVATGSAVASLLLSPLRGRTASPARYKAVAFDAFAIFDPRPIFGLAETLFPGKGADLSGAWRARQFEYQWLRGLSGQYEDFRRTTEDGLVFAARQSRIDLTPEKRARLMEGYLGLKPWPDVPAALGALKEAGLRLGFLSNMTTRLLESGIQASGLDGTFEHVLSTDRIRTYKPDPRAYRMAVDAFDLERGEIVFVSFAGWDAAGAKWFGYPTYWANRLDAPAEELGAAPDAAGKDLGDLVRFVRTAR